MEQQAVRLSLKYKITWGVAALGTSLISGIYGAMLPIFYQDYLGLSARWIGLAATIYAIWNAVNDPLFGFITDNTRSRLGRRIPYMRFTAPFLALTFVLVWFAPQGAGDTAQFLWMLLTMLLYDTAYTIIGLVYSALLPEISESDAERNGLQISSSLFAMLGMILGFLIPDLVRPQSGDTSLLPFRLAMIGVAVVGMALILFTTFKVKERKEFTLVDKPLTLVESVKYTFTSKSFLVLVSANFMSILTSSLVTSSMFYLADYVMQKPTIILLVALFVPILIMIPITSVLRSKFGVVRTQQLLLVVAGVGLMVLPLVPQPLIWVSLVLAGIGLSGPQVLTNVLFAQVSDEDEVRSGVRREGAFFGVNALITKPAQSVALWLVAFILEQTAFVTRESNGGQIFLDQPASAIFGIKTFIGLIPGISLLIGALILQFYPLKGVYLQEIKDKVLHMHAEKNAKLDSMTR
ncbi:MAG: MFS transporter [Anaerolineae bacterium]|jgi:GPH family glycoside/pentoside/hexuronide:cation symporter|nr:MFS transporter [Anaerolineae bacterium]